MIRDSLLWHEVEKQKVGYGRWKMVSFFVVQVGAKWSLELGKKMGRWGMWVQSWGPGPWGWGLSPAGQVVPTQMGWRSSPQIIIVCLGKRFASWVLLATHFLLLFFSLVMGYFVKLWQGRNSTEHQDSHISQSQLSQCLLEPKVINGIMKQHWPCIDIYWEELDQPWLSLERWVRLHQN